MEPGPGCPVQTAGSSASLWLQGAEPGCGSTQQPHLLVLSFAVITTAAAEGTACLDLHIWVFVLFINN